MSGKQGMLTTMRNQELFHEQVFGRLGAAERDPELKRILLSLSEMERAHAAEWQKLLKGQAQTRPAHARFAASAVLALRRLAGVALTVKILERMELDVYARFDRDLSKGGITRSELSTIERIRRAEDENERPLGARVIAHGSVLNNIRDVTFGMNDGLVEVLAAATGLGAALQAASLVFLAGFIVAVSGTLSMSAGAYLATNYEERLDTKKGPSGRSAKKSAYYVGAFYFLGALFPIAPFAFGIGSYPGILLSTLITVLVLTAVSALMAIVSDVRITRSVAKTLAVSLGAVVVTIAIGAYTRTVLHINI